MSRYEQISLYFNSNNSANMDVDRYNDIAEFEISTGLEIIDENGEGELLSSASRFFLNHSGTSMYLYAWNAFFKKKIIYYVFLLCLIQWEFFAVILNSQIKFPFRVSFYTSRAFPYSFRLPPIKLILPVAVILFLLKD